MRKASPHFARPRLRLCPTSNGRAVLTAAVLIGVLAATIGGCSSTPTLTGYERVYPEYPNRVETLDIQVFRETKHVTLTNTTATAFGPSTLWLNAWYSRPIDGLAVGETLHLPLASFRDEHGYAFRGGGFFAVEAPERLALTELESVRDDATVYYRLVVVGGEEG